jgi:hypothetical protein
MGRHQINQSINSLIAQPGTSRAIHTPDTYQPITSHPYQLTPPLPLPDRTVTQLHVRVPALLKTQI